MIKTLTKLFTVALIPLGLTACGTLAPPEVVSKNLLVERESIVIRSAYDAVDFLIDQERQTVSPQLVPRGGRGVLVSTIVDINDLDRSSALGRLLSEQIASRFAQHGIPVNELKLRGNLYVNKSQGELLLSREVRELSATQNADLVITGTYAESRDSVYVTIKLVRATDSRVSNAFNFVLVKTPAVAGLLRDGNR
jgi:TolB-like protein